VELPRSFATENKLSIRMFVSDIELWVFVGAGLGKALFGGDTTFDVEILLSLTSTTHPSEVHESSRALASIHSYCI